MIHNNKEEFLRLLERTSAQTGFPLSLLEKDYYLTILLSRINELSEDLVFKGGTCLNKIYYEYYRLSEDLDFSMRLPEGDVTRAMRRKVIKPIKEGIESFVRPLGLKVEDTERAGRNESTQYVYNIRYNSVVLDRPQSIKLEIGLRFNPILPVSRQRVTHRFVHPFTGEPLFDGGEVSCLSLKELVAEKLRAASTRLGIAPRDFYDLGYLIRAGFDFRDKELLKLFKQKLAEDGFDTDLKRYRVNLGRLEEEISEMESRIEAELLDVLTLEEKQAFDLSATLKALNTAFGASSPPKGFPKV